MSEELEFRQTINQPHCGVAPSELTDQQRSVSSASAATPTTCIETIGGDPSTAQRLSFQIKVF